MTETADIKPRLETDEDGKQRRLIIGDARITLGTAEYAWLLPVMTGGAQDLGASSRIHGKTINQQYADVIIHNIRNKMNDAAPGWVLVTPFGKSGPLNSMVEIRQRDNFKDFDPKLGFYTVLDDQGGRLMVYEGQTLKVAPTILLLTAAALFGKRVTAESYDALCQMYLGIPGADESLKTQVSRANTALRTLNVPFHIEFCRNAGTAGVEGTFYAGMPGVPVKKYGKQAAIVVADDYAIG